MEVQKQFTGPMQLRTSTPPRRQRWRASTRERAASRGRC